MAFDFPSNPPLGQTYTQDGFNYVWNGYAWMTGSGAVIGGGTEYVRRAGDVMTGFLTLHADPANPMHASTKQYVDSKGGVPTAGTDGQALVAQGGSPVWGAPIEGGNF